MPQAPRVLDLADPRAVETDLSGAKAANLARALTAGLSVLPGFVITTYARPGDPEIHAAWTRLTAGGELSLVVRSSSVIEDTGTSSMAGQFRSVLGVSGWTAFAHAVETVLASAAEVSGRGGAAPMAVLVQVEVAPECGGVLFGMDPATGDRRHFVVEVVAGSPDALVSGAVTADRVVLSRRGRRLRGDRVDGLLDRRRRRQLTRLARRAGHHFGAPQDVEWAYDRTGHLWLLQSRPVTATGAAAAGPVLGPGPVAETFPDQLSPLEADLWIEPLRRGVAEALHLTGAQSSGQLAASPIVTVIHGWAAADLDLLGVRATRGSLARMLDPRPPARRLLRAWKVGRLRVSLTSLAAGTIRETDARLRAVPALPELSEAQLLTLLQRVPGELAVLHTGEVLAGMLLEAHSSATAAGLALGVVDRYRRAGCPDAEVVARAPVTLALIPPRVGAPHPLPSVAAPPAPAVVTVDALEPREALRLRARWVQELSARAATELGHRLAADGRIPRPALVRALTLPELVLVAAGALVPVDLAGRRPPRRAAPLPAAFRLTGSGDVIALGGTPDGAAAGRGAAGGRAVGRVQHRCDTGVPPGAVLVVRTLDPALAGVLPGLAGLVSETGSTLSHLAILAREAGIPTVVGVPDALRRFPPGADVLVDGTTGEVSLVLDRELQTEGSA